MLDFLKLGGLHFGSFDLVVDPEGVYWFLACNTQGQWFWLDETIDYVISEAFADLLFTEYHRALEVMG
ncbi:MAG: hypothetical protein ACFB6R_17410 [Alphaproteobacteria bacterium]